MYLIHKLLSSHNLKIIKIHGREHGYRNKIYPLTISSSTLPIEKNNSPNSALIFYKKEDGILKKIKLANKISNFLAEKDFPTRISLPNTENKTIIKITSRHQQTTYACLYSYLDGQTVCWEAYTQKHLKLMGQTMSDIHQALKSFNHQPKTAPQAHERLNHNINKTLAYFQKPGVQKALNKKLKLKINLELIKKLQKNLTKINTKQTFQPLHLDFVRSNLLFKNTAKKNTNYIQFDQKNLMLTGILDFEKACFGPPIFDLARTLAFLLIDCKYKNPKKISKYFLYSGYQKRGKKDLPDLQHLKKLIILFQIYDFYKFLKHNPYQFLKKNEHFLRTCQRLRTNYLILGC